MNREMAPAHPHYALLAYAQEMHQYTLELWLELSNKLDAQERPTSNSERDSSNSVYEQPSRGGVASDDAESPQDE